MTDTQITITLVASYFMRACIFIAAAILAYYGKDGWGWLIFAGLATAVSFNKSKDGEEVTE